MILVNNGGFQWRQARGAQGLQRRSQMHRSRGFQVASPGAAIILVIAVISGLFVLARPSPSSRRDLEMWAFANTHVAMYRPLVEDWNKLHPDIRVELFQLGTTVELQRMMSGFYSQTPIADIMEIERGKVGAIFAGPLDKIGLYDLTPYLEQEHLFDQINARSFSPWTSRGHVFGLPHDVHPVMLAYRADIVEAAGINVSRIETWDDYVNVMRPLMNEKDAEGKPRHYLLNIWPTSLDQIEILILQGDGGYFDQNGAPTVDSDPVAEALCRVVAWTTGPGRIAADTPEFDAGANAMRVQGYVIGSMMPDWLGGVWQHDIPQLAGKVKLMPLPALVKGGRRTSVWGGTMLGISKRTPDFAKAWTFAKNLYTSPVVAEKLYREAGIVSPVKKMWSNPIYDEPVPYFCNQPAGRMFLKLAGDVPLRTSSPFYTTARERLQVVIKDLQEFAQKKSEYDWRALMPEARRLLAGAQGDLQRIIRQNQFEDPSVEKK